MTTTNQKQTALVRSHKLKQIAIPEACAKELGDNLLHERLCRPAFNRPCQALSFSGLKIFKFYEGGREVMVNAGMLEEAKPFQEKTGEIANKAATKIY
jgi:hypothetical protein